VGHGRGHSESFSGFRLQALVQGVDERRFLGLARGLPELAVGL
jgi:hypothetical protein